MRRDNQDENDLRGGGEEERATAGLRLGVDTGFNVLYMFLSVLDIVKKTGAALGVGVRLVSPREKLLRVSARNCVF